ncbi:unnamed protein product [Ceutorhynchus assimilis]|uniref:Rhodanese domain-containing protein n=1 Tax=Ceutorhynchus assimilis TaxID=467358 RepID=A0A9N9MXI4_9CUCU|nr:unnamed protein product [Ceutorhynchus assimilis]
MYRRFIITTILKASDSSYCNNFKNINMSACALTRPGNIVNYDQFKTLMQDEKVVVIDVRQPEELKEHGALPKGINVPLMNNELEEAFKSLTNEQFSKKYGHEKPDKDTPIIFSCMKGGRSTKAEEIALKLGYKNIKNFTGGWTEWAEKNKN